MITLSDVRNYCKDCNFFDFYYIGRLDSKKENSLGVYSLRNSNVRTFRTVEIAPISFLIHGSTNKKSTEELANNFYNWLYEKDEITLLCERPIDVDIEENTKIYEYVIECNFNKLIEEE